MPRSNSYVNGIVPTEGDPLRIDELGMTKEQVEQRKTNRKLLFAGTSLTLVLIFAILAAIVISHQKRDALSRPGQDQDGQNAGSTVHFPRNSLLTKLNRDMSKTESGIEAGCESTVVIIRHCEKLGPSVPDNDDNLHCSYVGHERAHFIPTLFGKENRGWPIPDLLYALSQHRHKWLNFREIETLQPLATKYGLEIKSQFTSNRDVVENYFSQLADGSMCGKTALLSWKHELMGELAELFGCPDCPSAYPEDTHDEVWQLKFVYQVMKTNIYSEKVYSSSNESASGNPSEGDRRQLRKKHKKHKNHSYEGIWSVFFSKSYQNFDPLAYSYSVGDYDASPTGGKWMVPQDEEM